jgi:carbon-monoxide dehydrogenase medium subunit
MKARLAAPSDLVDLTGIAEMKGIRVEGDVVVVGGGTTHGEVANSKDVQGKIPALAYMASTIGDPAVRHRGTMGGSVANNDPAADYPAALLALGATVVTNSREVPADEFFDGLFTTVLEPGEIVTAVKFPVPKRAGYAKMTNPASRYPMAGVFVAETSDGVRVAVTGSGEEGVFRHDGMEAALSSGLSTDAVDGVEVSADGLLSDIHASAEYRAHLIKVMAKRAIAAI